MASKKPPKPQPHLQERPESRSPRQVVDAAKAILANVRRGLSDVENLDVTHRQAGLLNVIAFGRAVTIALQRLKNITDDWDEWWAVQCPPKDPLLTYMNDLRNKILKQGELPKAINATHIQSFSGNPFELLEAPPPIGIIRGMFLGDQMGGNGWEVELPDGRIEKFYAKLIDGTGTLSDLYLTDAPDEFMGEPLNDKSVPGVARRYVTWLEKVVAEAEAHFVN